MESHRDMGMPDKEEREFGETSEESLISSYASVRHSPQGHTHFTKSYFTPGPTLDCIGKKAYLCSSLDLVII